LDVPANIISRDPSYDTKIAWEAYMVLCQECEREVFVLKKEDGCIFYSCGHKLKIPSIEEEVKEAFDIVEEGALFYESFGCSRDEALRKLGGNR
jgi:hypothetical protein